MRRCTTTREFALRAAGRPRAASTRAPTMQVVYHLWSPRSPDWLRVIADGLSRDDPRVPSVTFLWKGAEWAEREAYDMFGIIFEGNRDLRRIYMPPDYRQLPAAQGLPAARRRVALAGRGRPPHGADATSPPSSCARPVLREQPGTVQPGDRTGRHGARPATREPERSRQERHDRRDRASAPSTIPNIFVETPATIYDAVPPYPPRTRARGRVLRPRATARCSSTSGRSTPRPTACCASCSRSTASGSSTSTRCSATSIAASRRSARTATGTTPSATATRSSTSPRCSARRCRCWPRRSCSTCEVPRRAEYIRVLALGAQPHLQPRACSSAGWRSTWAA